MALKPKQASEPADDGVEVEIEEPADSVELEEQEGDDLFDLEGEAAHMDRLYETDTTPPPQQAAEEEDEPPARRRRRRKRKADADADDGAGDAAELDDDYDDDRASDPVKKRVNNLTRRMRRAERAQQHAEAQLASQNAEMESARKKGRRLEVQSLDAAIETHEGKVDGLKAKLKGAIEDGDTDTQVELQGEIAELQGQLAYARMRRPADEDLEAEEDEPAAAQPGQAQPGQQQAAPVAVDWINDNADWFEDPEYADARFAALNIAKDMEKEGIKVGNGEKYFAELEERLVKRIPAMDEFFEFEDEEPEPDPEPKPKPRRAKTPVAGDNGSGNPPSRERSTRVKLDAAELRKIEDWGLDSTDPKVLEEWARSKRGAAIDHPDS